MNIEAKLKRADELLKATMHLLEKQLNSTYVLDLLSESIYYDGTECDGSCLLEDIKVYLGIEEY